MRNLNAAIDQLELALRRLGQRWEQDGSAWDDSRRHDFEKTYWIPLQGEALRMLKEMRALSESMADARQKVGK